MFHALSDLSLYRFCFSKSIDRKKEFYTPAPPSGAVYFMLCKGQNPLSQNFHKAGFQMPVMLDTL
jgi:hypothetical protein